MIRVAVPKETAPGESRVAQVPDSIKRLAKLGCEVVVERGAGEAAGIDDAEFERAGATIAPSRAAALADARVVLSVQPPTSSEVAELPVGCLLVSFLPPARAAELVPALAARRVDALALERVPRTTRAQAVDALSSQATVAGYKAVLLGASQSLRLLPMLTTAAGTITPSKVFVLGAGVAGLMAIATARRLGAVVSAFDVRPAVKEQVQSLGATFVDIDGVRAEASGGYAAELARDQEERVREVIERHLPDMDLVITTAQIPGKPAPRLIRAEALARMKRGAVIVDLAADSGGNCAATEAGRTVVAGGVTVMGPQNLAASVPQHASMMFARNVQTLLSFVVKDAAIHLDLSDDIVSAMLVTLDGSTRL